MGGGGGEYPGVSKVAKNGTIVMGIRWHMRTHKGLRHGREEANDAVYKKLPVKKKITFKYSSCYKKKVLDNGDNDRFFDKFPIQEKRRRHYLLPLFNPRTVMHTWEGIGH